MLLNQIIEGLNNKHYSSKPRLNEQGDLDLSDEEKQIIDKYQPQNVFIVYGSLGPGRPNHHKMSHIQGVWSKATIRGKLEARGWGADLGYYGYIKTNTQEDKDIEAFILVSDELKANWQFLDDFEGNEYERILAEFRLENGETGVGNLYALKK